MAGEDGYPSQVFSCFFLKSVTLSVPVVVWSIITVIYGIQTLQGHRQVNNTMAFLQA